MTCKIKGWRPEQCKAEGCHELHAFEYRCSCGRWLHGYKKAVEHVVGIEGAKEVSDKDDTETAESDVSES